MSNFEDFDDISDHVKQNEDVVSLTMGQLRDAVGADKLGIHVRKQITSELHKRGLAAAPAELATYQHENVLIYRSGTKVAKLVDAVINPSTKAAGFVRDLVKTNDSAILEKVRALVCDDA